MVEKDIIAKDLKIKHQAIFDLGELYKIMFRWFAQHNYDFQEKEYMEKALPNDSKQLEIAWFGRRKISDYIRFHIDVKFLIIGLKSTEVEIDSIKKKLDSGSLEMRFSAYIEKDYEDKWVNPPMKFLREVYDKFIIRRRLEDYEEQIHDEVYELMNEVKAFLNLYKFQTVET